MSNLGSFRNKQFNKKVNRWFTWSGEPFLFLSFLNAPTHLISLPTPPPPLHWGKGLLGAQRPCCTQNDCRSGTGCASSQASHFKARPWKATKTRKEAGSSSTSPTLFQGRSVPLPGLFLLQLLALFHACCHGLPMMKRCTKSKRSQFLKGVFILKSMTRKPLFAIMKSFGAKCVWHNRSMALLAAARCHFATLIPTSDSHTNTTRVISTSNMSNCWND